MKTLAHIARDPALSSAAGIRVLLLLMSSPRGLLLTEIAEALGKHPVYCSALLADLRRLGYATSTRDGRLLTWRAA